MKKILFIILAVGSMILIGVNIKLLLTNNQTQEPNNQVTPVEQNDTQTEDQSPTVSTITATDEKSGIAFSYPENFNYKYVSVSEWPPRFISSYAPIDCELHEQTRAMSGLSDRTETINGTSYCIWERKEGATGSIYTNYQVSYKQEDQYVTMSFTLRYPQCGNYPEAESQACQKEQAEFPINGLIDEIAKSTILPSQ